MDMTRRQTTVRLPEYLLADLHAEARRRGMSMSRLIESFAMESMYRPTEETLAALEECRSGEGLEELPPDALESFENFKDYVQGL